MAEVVNIKDGKIKRTNKKFKENGIDTDKIMLCMNAQNFSILVSKIMRDERPTADILNDNTDLFFVGYLQEEDGNILLMEPCF